MATCISFGGDGLVRRRRQRTVLRGTLALAGAGFVAKLLSAFQRVLVARWLGAEAIGLFEMAAPLLSAALTLCSFGLPVALSAAVARAFEQGDLDGALRVLRWSRMLLFGFGVLGSTLLIVLAHPLSRAIGNPRTQGVIMVIAPAVLLATLLAGERAWLQGSGRVPASAATVAAEQFSRVSLALITASRFIGSVVGHSQQAAEELAWSPLAGAGGGLLSAVVADRVIAMPTQPWQRRRTAPRGDAVEGLVRTGFANWSSGAITSLALAVDTALTTWRLRESGETAYGATAGIGALNGMALPLAVAPVVLFGALGSALLPSSAADWARNDIESLSRRGKTAYFWALATAVPCAIVLCQFSVPICRFLYHNVAAAGPLTILSFAGIPLGLTYVAGVLANAADKAGILVPGVSVAALAKTSLILALTGSFGLGVRGAAFAAVAGWGINALWTVRAVGRLTGCLPPWRRVLRTLLPATVLQIAVSWIGWKTTGGASEVVSLVLSVMGGVAAYGLVLALSAPRPTD